MINGKMTIRSVIEKYPDTSGLFVAAGLGDLIEGEKFEKVASFLTLESALKSSGKDPHTFIKELSDQIKTSQISTDITLLKRDQTDWDAIGVIPMAIHLQMLEAFETFTTDLADEKSLEFSGRMASAQEGSEWIAELYQDVEDPTLLPDICLGRGYDFFFSKTFQKRFIETGVFHKGPAQQENSDFKGLGLQDPKGNYNVFAVIPAVFVVKESALNDLPIPRTWEALLGSDYKNYVAMPDCNADLPRAVLLSLYSRFGEDGVRRLASNVSQLLHPSQLVKKIRSSAKDAPAVSIMPYFFSQVVQQIPGITVVWPEDGTVVEPLYILSKSESKYCKSDSEAMEAAKDFFLGSTVASIFAKGNFPALHPDVNNGIPDDVPLWWVGWDFLGKHDVIALAANLHAIFDAERGANRSNE